MPRPSPARSTSAFLEAFLTPGIGAIPGPHPWHQRHPDRTHVAPASDAREHVEPHEQDEQPDDHEDRDQEGQHLALVDQPGPLLQHAAERTCCACMPSGRLPVSAGRRARAA